MLPLILFPLLLIMPMGATASQFGDELIFLFLGGFLLQLAMERWGLHRRLALVIILAVGTRPARLVAGIMIATAALSMWISNAAAAAMMLPIGMSVCQLVAAREGGGDVARSPHRHVRNIGICVMIGIAWAATIGGIATPIGTAPNVLMRGFMRERFGIEPSFIQWMALCTPMAIILLLVSWLLLTKWMYPVAAGGPHDRAQGKAERLLLGEQLRGLGPVNSGEWATMIVFALAVGGWVFGGLISKQLGLTFNGKAAINDSVVAMLAGLALFVIPVSVRRQEFVLDWKHAARVPYGVLLLFGGGLALAKGIEHTHLDVAIGQALQGVGGLHPLAVVLIVTAVCVFLSEFMSNTALTATLLPIIAGVATAIGAEPIMLLLPLTLGASCAFMMPAGTPPSAIAFSSGYFGIRDMARPGLVLNVVGIVLIAGMVYFFGPRPGAPPEPAGSPAAAPAVSNRTGR
jgi:sodium-dependent dicarboxylate transporter 2/3/5